MSAGFFRGTTHDQDARFGNAEKRLLKKMSFAKVLSTKVINRSRCKKKVSASFLITRTIMNDRWI